MRYSYVYYIISEQPESKLIKPRINMLYDTYGEEYLTFLQELNEILSLNELVELDYM